MHTRPNQAEFDALLAHKRAEVKDLARHLVAGTLGPQEWADRMRAALVTGHARAGYLGRTRGGDVAPFDADDTEFGRMVADDEQPFLDRFRQDLESGRYEDEDGRLLLLPVLGRAAMYVDRMLGTANEAFVGTSGSDLLWWKLGPSESGSCEECPKLAAGSHYRASELTRTPGDCSTPCVSNCKCWISREDGISGFRAPRLK
jgi:hypothetical protein